MSTRSKLKQASFTFDGKRYFCYGNTIEEARQKASAKRALLEAGIREASGSQTVRQWAYVWLRSYKEGVVSDAWYDQLERFVEKAVIPEIGDMRVKDVKPIDITRLLNKHSDKSESYCKTLLQVVKQIFDSAEENDLIIKDPAKRAKISRCKPKTGHRTITSFERDLTLRTAKKHPADGLFFLIMLYCGCRPQEVAALRMKDVDLEKKILHVTRSRKTDDVIRDPKTAAGVRDIPIPDALCVYLEALNKKPNELVCTNTRGEMITRSSQSSLWNRFRREMELEHGTKLFRNALQDPILPDDFVPYCYRHTYCTDLQDAGVPVTVASYLMGHRSISVTADIYTHHSQESFESARTKINSHQDTAKGTAGGTTQGTTSM